jgi:hypothetical protein
MDSVVKNSPAPASDVREVSHSSNQKPVSIHRHEAHGRDGGFLTYFFGQPSSLSPEPMLEGANRPVIDSANPHGSPVRETVRAPL